MLFYWKKQHVPAKNGWGHKFLQRFVENSWKSQFFQGLSSDEKNFSSDSSSSQTSLAQKKAVLSVVASKSKYTVKGTSPKYLKLSWKEIISPLSKQEVMPSLAPQTLVCFFMFS